MRACVRVCSGFGDDLSLLGSEAGDLMRQRMEESVGVGEMILIFQTCHAVADPGKGAPPLGKKLSMTRRRDLCEDGRMLFG